MKSGDKVIVNDQLEIQFDGEEIFIGEKATIVNIDNWIYPVSIKFDCPEIQEVYSDLGERRFSLYELTIVE